MSLSSSEWAEIKPISNGKRLEGPWANIVSQGVAEVFPSCAIRFKRNFVRQEISRKKAMYVRITAKCKFNGKFKRGRIYF